MPVYVYRCESCGSLIEKRQSFSDAPLTECQSCHGRLQKLIQPAPIIYKGSGFYSTDYKSKSGGNGRNGHHEEKASSAAESGDSAPAASDDTGKTKDSDE